MLLLSSQKRVFEKMRTSPYSPSSVELALFYTLTSLIRWVMYVDNVFLNWLRTKDRITPTTKYENLRPAYDEYLRRSEDISSPECIASLQAWYWQPRTANLLYDRTAKEIGAWILPEIGAFLINVSIVLLNLGQTGIIARVSFPNNSARRWLQSGMKTSSRYDWHPKSSLCR